ncbi:hypothetical protein ANN_06838 [Periplaneta americana]|uniref:Uncharacterized protein n=1 Tax=Periplaneta americana TaxID=6978 RepID=A0ABQ8TGJ8_PERAM|nr:hypothetical protein ANN_06838 [Periplaneta americana]
MFGVPMKMGIASSVVPRDLVNNVNTEEDLEKMLNTGTTDSEEREDNGQGIDDGTEGTQLESTVEAGNKAAGSQQESAVGADEEAAGTQHLTLVEIETADSPSLPDGCDETLRTSYRVEKVKRFREAAKEGLEMQAKKMKAAICNKIPKLSVGQNVRIKVPDEDRAKIDAKSIIAVVINIQDDEFYQLGTKAGKLKRTNTRYGVFVRIAGVLYCHLKPLFSVMMSTVNAEGTPVVLLEWISNAVGVLFTCRRKGRVICLSAEVTSPVPTFIRARNFLDQRMEPDQKLKIVNEYIWPGLIYPLQCAPLDQLPDSFLKDLDKVIRSAVEEMISLPDDTPNDMLYSSKKEKKTALKRLKIPEVNITPRTTGIHLRDELRKRSFDSRCQLPHKGKGVVIYEEYPRANSWVSTRRNLSSSEYINAIKMSCNLTAVRSVPGRAFSTTRCRQLVCNKPETLGHMLGFCRKGELLRNNRHHRVRGAIACLLRNKGWEVHKEVHCISEDDSHRRADVRAINRQ